MDKFYNIIRLIIKSISSILLSSLFLFFIICINFLLFYNFTHGYRLFLKEEIFFTLFFTLFFILFLWYINWAIWTKGNVRKIILCFVLICFFLFVTILTMGPD